MIRIQGDAVDGRNAHLTCKRKKGREHKLEPVKDKQFVFIFGINQILPNDRIYRCTAKKNYL